MWLMREVLSAITALFVADTAASWRIIPWDYGYERLPTDPYQDDGGESG